MKMRSYYLGELTWPDVKEFLAVHDAHTGEFETSTTLANRENFVVKERIKKPKIKLPKSKYTKI